MYIRGVITCAAPMSGEQGHCFRLSSTHKVIRLRFNFFFGGGLNPDVPASVESGIADVADGGVGGACSGVDAAFTIPLVAMA